MFDRLRQKLNDLFRLFDPDSPPASGDPHVGVREPRRRGPNGRTSAVAVAEPDEDLHVRAIGSRRIG